MSIRFKRIFNFIVTATALLTLIMSSVIFGFSDVLAMALNGFSLAVLSVLALSALYGITIPFRHTVFKPKLAALLGGFSLLMLFLSIIMILNFDKASPDTVEIGEAFNPLSGMLTWFLPNSSTVLLFICTSTVYGISLVVKNSIYKSRL